MRQFEKRFGMIAVGQGFITLAQLAEAMQVQVTKDIEESTHRLIGEILIEMEALSPNQVLEILKVMDRGLVEDHQIRIKE